MFHFGLFLFYNVNVRKYKNIIDPKTNDGKHGLRFAWSERFYIQLENGSCFFDLLHFFASRCRIHFKMPLILRSSCSSSAFSLQWVLIESLGPSEIFYTWVFKPPLFQHPQFNGVQQAVQLQEFSILVCNSIYSIDSYTSGCCK